MEKEAKDLWYKHAVFYELYIRAFCDSNADGMGDLQGVIQNLDYIKDLGVDCIWLLPYYESPLLDDGYDVADYYQVHPDYGKLEDLRELLNAAHERGIRVIADLVLNHTSYQHHWFQEARANPNSPYHNFYVWSDTKDKYAEARIIFIDSEESNWTWDESVGKYYWHRFYSSQPDLNFDNPAVQREMFDVAAFWLSMGLDGFRADAVPYLYEREGTNCENLPETHAYLKQLRSYVNENFPDKILLCEANQWPKDVREYFGDGDEFHMGFHFPVMPRLYMALALADRSPIVEILKATPEIPEDCQWCTFLRNHDELTLEMVTDLEREFMWNTYAPIPRMRLNLGIRRRLAPLVDGDRRRIELLNSLLFTLPGSPIIYYGDEIGMGDNIWIKDRDGVRTPMQWNSGYNAGFSSAPTEKLYHEPINEGVYSYEFVNVEAQRQNPDSLWHTIREMIAVRKQHKVFGLGGIKFKADPDTAVFAFTRSYNEQSILAVHNLSDVERTAQLDLSSWEGKVLRGLLGGRLLAPISSGLYKIDLRPYEYLWLEPIEAY